MGPPILAAPQIPTTLQPTQGEAVVQAKLAVEGQEWLMTCGSMGNPHAVTFGTADGKGIKVGGMCVGNISMHRWAAMKITVLKLDFFLLCAGGWAELVPDRP